MITHEEARDRLIKCYRKHSYLDNITRFRLLDYITEQQAKDKVHEELVSLVKKVLEEKRYIEWNYALEELKEYMKVGKEK